MTADERTHMEGSPLLAHMPPAERNAFLDGLQAWQSWGEQIDTTLSAWRRDIEQVQALGILRAALSAGREGYQRIVGEWMAAHRIGIYVRPIFAGVAPLRCMGCDAPSVPGYILADPTDPDPRHQEFYCPPCAGWKDSDA